MIERLPRALAPNSAGPVPNLATTSPDNASRNISTRFYYIELLFFRIRQSCLCFVLGCLASKISILSGCIEWAEPCLKHSKNAAHWNARRLDLVEWWGLLVLPILADKFISFDVLRYATGHDHIFYASLLYSIFYPLREALLFFLYRRL